MSKTSVSSIPSLAMQALGPRHLPLLSPAPLTRTSMHAHYVLVDESKDEKSSDLGPLSPTPPPSPSPVALMGGGLVRGKRTASSMSLPPQLETTPTINHTMRFRATSALAGTLVGFGSLIGSFGSMCTVTNSKVVSVGSSIRLISVTIWPPGSTTADSAFIDWNAGVGSGYSKDSSKLVSIPDGISVTTAVVFRPPRRTLCGAWLNAGVIAGSTALFNIYCPAGAIVDVKCQMTLSNVSGGITQTIASGVQGNYYYIALDGPASNLLYPPGVNTTH